MRPVRLEAEGFTCYRERQAPLDFSGLSLFAIAGPTGAGKSSILDTILFALYGEVPRIGKQGIGEFIAHGRDRMSVTLDFRVRGSLYRVSRQVKRGRKSALTTTALLAELPADGGPEKSLAEGVKPVNEQVAHLLGLDFEAFTQTVILPQGEFAKFLRSEPKEQRAILQHLLRHDIFTRMREEAERLRIEIGGELAGVERELKAFEAATPEALADRQQALAAGRDRLARLAAARAAQEQHVSELRARRALTEEVQRLRQRQADLQEESARIDALRAELDAARRAARVVPRIEAHEAAARDLQERERALQAAESALALAARGLAAAEAQGQRALAAAADLPALARRIQAIDEIKGDLARREALQQRAGELSSRLPALHTQASSAAAALARARDTDVSARSRAAAARAAVQQLAYEPDDHRRVDGLMVIVARIRALDDELATLRDAVERRQADAERAERAATEATRRFAAAERDARAATTAEEAAAKAYEQALDQHRAAHLRGHLQAGERCPVCEQVVASVPAGGGVPALDALKQARASAAAQAQKTQQVRQTMAESRAAQVASRDAAMTAHADAVATLQGKVELRRRWVAEVAAAAGAPVPAAAPRRSAATVPEGLPLFDDAGDRAGDLVDDDAREELLAEVERRSRELSAARERFESARLAAQQAEGEAATAAVALARAEAAERAAVQARDQVASDAQATADELAGVLGRIAAVSTDADPAAERTRMAAQMRQLEQQVQVAQQQLGDAQRSHAAAEERVATQSAALTGARDGELKLRDVLARELAESGFATAAEAAAAARDMATQQQLDARTRTFEQERSAALGRLAELEPQLAGRAVSAGELAAAETACDAVFADWRAAELETSALASACERLAVDVERRAHLAREREAVQRRLAVHAEMAADLKGDAFQEYLLQEAFHALVQGASVRLRQISNRYTLEWQDGDFFVIDHDNAGERRRAETLSGGETFMASLCLALQLSDEVLKTSGALQMDSLFIDEGFGTLDAEALSEVTDTMEALRQDGSRLIGVISHRPELTERLPGCIRVHKGAGESTWQLERVG